MTKRVAVVVVVVALLGAGGVTAWWLSTPRNGIHAEATVPVDTATVVRTTLTTTTHLSAPWDTRAPTSSPRS